MKFLIPEHDGWRAVDGDAPAAADRRLLTAAQWRAVGSAWPAGLSVGLLLDNADDVQQLGFALGRFDTIALQFPRWTDGRAYSQARLLRLRLRWRGELRAQGDVVVDMALQLARTGFDAAVLRAGQDPRDGERALRFFDGLLPPAQPHGAPLSHYQGDVLDPQPLFLKAAA